MGPPCWLFLLLPPVPRTTATQACDPALPPRPGHQQQTRGTMKTLGYYGDHEDTLFHRAQLSDCTLGSSVFCSLSRPTMFKGKIVVIILKVHCCRSFRITVGNLKYSMNRFRGAPTIWLYRANAFAK